MTYPDSPPSPDDGRFGPWMDAHPPAAAGEQHSFGQPVPPPRRNSVVIWGLVGSAVLLVLLALAVPALVDDDPDPVADDSSWSASAPSSSSSSRPPGTGSTSPVDVVGVPPSDSPPATVLDACYGMMPVLMYADREMAEADTEAETMQVVADMHAAVVWAGGAPDATFREHLQRLEADLQAIMDAARARVDPPGLAAGIEDHSFVVGKDCGLHGWTE